MIEGQGGLVAVREIRCPVHGDVTDSVAEAFYEYPEWDGRATVQLVRKGLAHPGCGEPLLWDVGPVSKSTALKPPEKPVTSRNSRKPPTGAVLPFH